MVELARIDPKVRPARTRDLILWCVEAFFGHLGGDGVVHVPTSGE
jgi:hypothetical protein